MEPERAARRKTGMNKFVILLLLLMGPSIWVAVTRWNMFVTAPYYMAFLALILLFALCATAIERPLASLAARRAAGTLPRFRTPFSARELDALMITVVALSVLHYIRLGEIPLLSANIDVLRFEVSDSGLFGIPSRGATVGPILLLACVCAAWSSMTSRMRLVHIVVIVLLSAIRGHKSALVEYVLYVLLVVPWVLRADRVFLAGAAGVLSGIFVYMSTASYATVDAQYGFLDYIAARSALYQHDLVAFLLNSSIRYDAMQVGREAIYPILKVLDPSLQTLNQTLSTAYYNVDYGNFTVPVTPGPVGLGILINERYGLPAIAFLTVVGSSFIYNLRKRALDDRVVAGLNYLLFTLFVAVSAGNFFYWMSNSLASALIILALASVPLLLTRAMRRLGSGAVGARHSRS